MKSDNCYYNGTVNHQPLLTNTTFLSFKMDLKTIFLSNPLDLFNLNDSKTARTAPKIKKKKKELIPEK